MIFFLLKTDLVPTKKLPVAGFLPHTIAGAPSIFTDKKQVIKKASNTASVPVRMLSSGCSRWVFFVITEKSGKMFVVRETQGDLTPLEPFRVRSLTLIIYQRKTPFGGFGVQFKNRHRVSQNTLGVAPLPVLHLTTC